MPYGVTLERNTDQLMASVPHIKHAIRRAEIYARSEMEAILSAPRQPRDRVFLMTVYACGLRLAEARHLKTTDIDRAQMQLRVRNGKGAKCVATHLAFVSIIMCHVSGSISQNRAGSVRNGLLTYFMPRPALFTRISRRPKRFIVVSITISQLLG
jgi:integrase